MIDVQSLEGDVGWLFVFVILALPAWMRFMIDCASLLFEFPFAVKAAVPTMFPLLKHGCTPDLLDSDAL